MTGEAMFGCNWRCDLCDESGRGGRTEAFAYAALQDHMRSESHRVKQADNERKYRIKKAAPEMLALLESEYVRHDVTLTCNACGHGFDGHDVGCPIGDLLARIDGTP
jgi:rubrerythrin